MRSDAEDNSLNLTVNRQIHVYTHITLTQNEAIKGGLDIWNILEFVCDYSDACDRTFILHHLKWLVTENYNNLASALRPLFPIEDGNREQCIIDNGDEVQSCVNGICHSQYSMSTKRMESVCIQIPEMVPYLLLITYVTTEKNIYEETEQKPESEQDTANQDFRIEYHCQPNNCKNQLIRKQMRNVIRDHYNLSTMYKVLKVKVEEDWREKEEEEITTTTAATINTTQPDNDSISQHLSYHDFILHILLLFVASILISNIYA